MKGNNNEFMPVTVETITSKDLLECRRQEMEDYMLPNQVTFVKIKSGKTIPVFSKEVR